MKSLGMVGNRDRERDPQKDKWRHLLQKDKERDTMVPMEVDALRTRWTNEEYKKLREENRCLKCGRSGHAARNCQCKDQIPIKTTDPKSGKSEAAHMEHPPYSGTKRTGAPKTQIRKAETSETSEDNGTSK